VLRLARYTDLAPLHPEIVERMLRRLEELRESAFLPIRCQCEDGFGGISCNAGGCADKRACEMVTEKYGGFWGPFVDVP
jgi:hypothetical protein